MTMSRSSSPPVAPRGVSGTQPPDPVFPSLENEIDEKLVKELVEGKRSQSQAKRVLQELSSVCRAASVELEVMLQVRTVHDMVGKACRATVRTFV